MKQLALPKLQRHRMGKIWQVPLFLLNDAPTCSFCLFQRQRIKTTKIRPELLQNEENICSGTSAMENNPPLLPQESCLWSHPALLSVFSCKVHIKKCERKFSNWKIKSSAIPPERKTLIWLSRSIILSLLVWEMSSLFSLLPGRAEALRFNNECSHSLPIS